MTYMILEIWEEAEEVLRHSCVRKIRTKGKGDEKFQVGRETWAQG